MLGAFKDGVLRRRQRLIVITRINNVCSLVSVELIISLAAIDDVGLLAAQDRIVSSSPIYGILARVALNIVLVSTSQSASQPTTTTSTETILTNNDDKLSLGGSLPPKARTVTKL